MPDLSHDPAMTAYLLAEQGRGRGRCLRDVAVVLADYGRFLAKRSRTAATAGTEDVCAYAAFLASPAAALDGQGLAVTTQATRLGMIRGFHRWLRRRGLAITNPAADLALPRIDRRRVRKDYLTLLEAQAYLATAAAAVDAATPGSMTWAAALRDLAMAAIALATGRRCAGLCTLALEHLNPERLGLRVEREKGHIGRLLPVVSWAVRVAITYRDQARPVLLGGRSSPYLFVGRRDAHVGLRTWDATVRRLQRDTVAARPDLVDLPRKTISTHTLRVTTARLLFLGGCPIRIINEILLHRHLSTTAAYTPVELDDLRRALIAAHPRA